MARCSEWLVAVAILLGSSGCGPIPPDEQDVPEADPEAIHAFLSSRDYADWDAETRVHPGLNGTGRRVFLSERADYETSPVGAAAVREIYDGTEGDAALLGWSVLIKVDDTGDSSRDWFFYETFDQESSGRFSVAARGANGCTFCHGSVPDTIQSRRPLP